MYFFRPMKKYPDLCGSHYLVIFQCVLRAQFISNKLYEFVFSSGHGRVVPILWLYRESQVGQSFRIVLICD